ncbi:MAG: PLD nuclease N-terminal domain-containing protein [Planctomycetota bacterium]
MEGLFLLVPIVAVLLGLLGTVLWVWALVECAMKEPSEGNEKLLWIVVIILTHWIGALIYFLVRRPQRIAQFGR